MPTRNSRTWLAWSIWGGFISACISYPTLMCATKGLRTGADSLSCAISGWRSGRIEAPNLAPFTDLRSLDVCYTTFNDAGMKTLQGLKQIRRLNLRDTLITDDGS
jgi:hypothetical protein